MCDTRMPRLPETLLPIVTFRRKSVIALVLALSGQCQEVGPSTIAGAPHDDRCSCSNVPTSRTPLPTVENAVSRPIFWNELAGSGNGGSNRSLARHFAT